MDVSLTVSLMREQLGTVIAQAVTAAVETVLGEMVKVVGSKLEEYSKEMTAKEKENESIKQMLEISQCQMKTMRKYLSAVIAKDERHVLMTQRNSVCKQNEVNRTYRPPAAESQLLPGAKRTNKGGDATLTVNAKGHNLLTQNSGAYSSEGLVRAASSCERSPAKPASGHDLVQESATRGTEDSFDTTIQGGSREASDHVTRMKEESREHSEGENGCQRKEEAHEPGLGARQQSSSQGERMATPDSDSPSVLKSDAGVAADKSASTVWDPPVQAKEEEAEIEIICIKEEPEEVESYPPMPPCPGPAGERGSPLDIIGPADRENPEELTEASFTAASALMYPDAHRQPAGTQRQARWRYRMRDPGLYEEHKHRKAELKRRSQHRRREREKSLPQPLLAALERERREKNRIRVARWRAKRKLQAGLVTSQPAQFNYTAAQTGHMQQNDKFHCHPQYSAAPQPSNLLYSSPQCENSTIYPSLPFNSNSLLPGLRHDT